MARIFNKKEGTITFDASSQESLKLSRNYHVDHYMCQLKMNATFASASLKNGTILDLINDIQIISNGNKTHKNLKPIGIKLSQVIDHKQEILKDVTTTDGTRDVYLFFRVDFSLNNMRDDFDTIENVSLFESLDFIVNWGSASTLGTGITVNSASLEVYSAQMVDFRRPANANILRNIETNATYDVIGNNDQFNIDLTTEQYYDKLFICSTSDGASVDTVINKITLKSGETVITNLDALAMRADNISEYNPIDRNDFLGAYIIDFSKLRRSLLDLLDTTTSTGGFKTLQLVLDVTKQGTACKIHIFRRTIENTNLVEA